MKNSKKFLLGSLLVALIVGISAGFAAQNTSLEGRIKNTEAQEEALKKRAAFKEHKLKEKRMKMTREEKNKTKKFGSPLPPPPPTDSENSYSTLPTTAVVNISFTSRSDDTYASIITPTLPCSATTCRQIAELTMEATGDELDLQFLTLSNDDNADDYSARFGTIYLVEVATGNLIDTTSMMDAGGPNDGTVEFNGFSYLFPQNTSTELAVYAEIHNVTRASHTGSFAKLYLAGTSSNEVEFIEQMSGNTLPSTSITNDANNGDAKQQVHVIRRTKPTVSYNNDEITDTITGTTNAKEVYKFTIAADPNENVEWAQLTFDVSETAGLSSSNYKLYIEGQPTALNTSGSWISGGEVVIWPSAGTQSIAAGSFTTYVLESDITITDSANSQTLSVELTAEDDTALIQGYPVSNLNLSDFVWSDRAAMSHTPFTNDWTNGYLVTDMDVETVNIAYQGTGGPVPSGPDVTISDLDYDFINGTLLYTVSNIGNESVDIDIADHEFAFSITQGSLLLDEYFEVDYNLFPVHQLEVGESMELAFPLNTLISGTSSFTVCADVDWQVTELNESNNCETRTISSFINRIDFLEMLFDMEGLVIDNTASSGCIDLTPTQDQLWGTAADMGIVEHGYVDADGIPTGFCGPEDFITRAEGAKVIVQYIGNPISECSAVFSDVDYSAWYGPYVDTLCSELGVNVVSHPTLSQFTPSNLLEGIHLLSWLNAL